MKLLKMNIGNLSLLSIMVLFFVTTISIDVIAQGDRVVNLRGKWLFQLGDNEEYADPNYNDSEWEEIYAPSTWQREGFYNYSGYAWYRKTFEFDNDINTGSMYLKLGRIDDCDEVYLNGHFIGGTGGLPPDYFTAYNADRTYFIPDKYLSQNGRNTIAVRVFDEGGEGGIVDGSLGIYRYDVYSEKSINLAGNWKFRLSDDLEYAEKNYNDKDWDNIIVPASWENQGFYEYDGFAWYRKRFTVPDEMLMKDMILILGKIDDMDQVFINGHKVGETGNIEKKWARDDEWDKYRIYYIPNGLLKMDNENTIAVRVYDQEMRGGIYQGPVAIVPRTEYKTFWKEYYRTVDNDFVRWIKSFQY